jgi:hypothetical protein
MLKLHDQSLDPYNSRVLINTWNGCDLLSPQLDCVSAYLLYVCISFSVFMTFNQGCQMAFLITKSLNLGVILGDFEWVMLVLRLFVYILCTVIWCILCPFCILWPFGVFGSHLVWFVLIWYIPPFWYTFCTKIWYLCFQCLAKYWSFWVWMKWEPHKLFIPLPSIL